MVSFFSPQKEHNLAFGCWPSWKVWQMEESKFFLLDCREQNLFSRAKETPKCPLFPAVCMRRRQWKKKMGRTQKRKNQSVETKRIKMHVTQKRTLVRNDIGSNFWFLISDFFQFRVEKFAENRLAGCCLDLLVYCWYINAKSMVIVEPKCFYWFTTVAF